MSDTVKIWKTKEGNDILINDMTDSHLLNSIKFLERYEQHVRWNLVKQIDFLLGGTTGEIAQDMMNDHIDDLIMDHEDSPDLFEEYCPAYYDLVEEAKSRGLI